ncbi:hypothetical protein QJ854_gp255 [Moumouvirus goulette]|uniref:Uncharacterized protein n=1 Tax=Moumouvirus goulette TaxID=1247379 RepID=M1PXN0_9VIRU|nr:hypothetical protein QJ854_gp255 [Moumouvirus goulette]AGF85527.1 hypothetical protein glt_00722 [Moumouvirus goulette]
MILINSQIEIINDNEKIDYDLLELPDTKTIINITN